MKYNYIILGAGPAGLSFANKLIDLGEADFLLIEKEATAGGLCRSVDVDGAPFDIGGGHFLDVRRPKVNNYLFGFMPEEEWNLYDRKTTIRINNKEIGQPIEANIWQMNIDDQVDYLKSIAVAGCNIGKPMPVKFIDWIYWKLGDRIAKDYMIPYNKKMFGEKLNELGTYWLEKLPNVSFEETLRSCLEKKAFGTDPGHTHFYYPKEFGYGELWMRMARRIDRHIVYNSKVEYLDAFKGRIMLSDKSEYFANKIITTIPWMEFKDIKGLPDSIKQCIKKLKYSSIQTEYFADRVDSESHWIYEPDIKKSYHRILVRHNFCPGSKGYWTETNTERLNNKSKDGFSFFNEYAYPLNTIEKPQIMEKLLKWSAEHNIYGLGRWGEHCHYNSDLVVELAIMLAEKLCNE